MEKIKEKANNNRTKIFHCCPRLTGVTLTEREAGWKTTLAVYLRPLPATLTAMSIRKWPLYRRN